PSRYQVSYFFGDYAAGFIRRLDADNAAFEFWPSASGPVDLKVGPDGMLYFLSIFDGAVYVIRPSTGARPVAVISANPTSGAPPLTVSFDGSGSTDPNNNQLTYTWDFGDQSPAGSGIAVSHTFAQRGTYAVTLTVDNGQGGQASAQVRVVVGSPTAT